jgi:hypothetical protein
MNVFERYPKLVDFCTRISSNYTGVSDNKVEYVRDNLLRVNNCSCVLMDDVNHLVIYPENDNEPVLVAQIIESVKVSLNFVSSEIEIGGTWASNRRDDKQYKDYSYGVFTKTLKEMGVSQTTFAKYDIINGMPIEKD